MTHTTGVAPQVVGKPARYVIEHAAHLTVATPQSLAVVADAPDLEITMGRDAGALTVLVLTGAEARSAVTMLIGRRRSGR